jgi:hypothetical protein
MADKRDDLWTYIGQSTWVLQIAPSRYLIRSTYRNVLDAGASMSLICIDVVDGASIQDFLRLTDGTNESTT